MLEKMRALVKRKDMCVLATVSDNRPHCSLMAYVTDEECREIYMVTDKLTKKYGNLTANPAACLLIDTRDEDVGSARIHGKALTVNGTFREIEDEERKSLIQDRLLERHPHLTELTLQPDTTIFGIKIESFLLLEGPTHSTFETVG